MLVMKELELNKKNKPKPSKKGAWAATRIWQLWWQWHVACCVLGVGVGVATFYFHTSL
jgi:hypothetical protein